MTRFGDEFGKRRAANLAAIQKAYGTAVRELPKGIEGRYRRIRLGEGGAIFTVGYERRSGEELMALLRDAGVDMLADIREKPVSRVADFRASSLQALCADAGINYESWTGLGSTENQREQLKETGDFAAFERRFRSYAVRYCARDLDQLAEVTKIKCVALLCYERRHEDCHRSVVADLLAERNNASIFAI
jgi:uncharacterized protein (DUF488 family)